MVLWRQSEVREAIRPLLLESSLKDAETEIHGISIDTRTLKPGDLFVALEGQSDGHLYISEALKAGAAALLLEEKKLLHLKPFLAEANFFAVVHSLKALELLGDAARSRSQARIIGVTGSVGKTSVCRVLGQLLEAQAPTVASQKSYNNHIGVPLSLSQLSREARYGVFEMGMNAPMELRRLSLQVRPHVALVTTIGQAHLGPLGSMEAIAKAKGEVFSGLVPGEGVAVINQNSPCMDLLVRGAQESRASRIVIFGFDPNADVFLKEREETAEGQRIVLQAFGKDYRVQTSLRGIHWVSNILGMFATLSQVGADLEQACEDFFKISPVEGRGRLEEILTPSGRITLIDETYNANPTSVRAALSVLRGLPGRKIVVLGDMLELGSFEEELHVALADEVRDSKIGALYTCGPLMKALHKAVEGDMKALWRKNAQELAFELGKDLMPGDVVLIKGSNGMKMIQVLEYLKSFGIQKKQEGQPTC